jgi:hypothetical protein
MEHVQALNMIDVLFNGKSGKDLAIRRTWLVYLDFLNQRPPSGEEPARAHNEKGVDLLVNLLAEIATSLRYDFDKVHLKRGGYYPQGQATESQARLAILDALAKMLTSANPALPMSVVSFPVSEDALKSQMDVQQALLRTLSGETPLTIKQKD